MNALARRSLPIVAVLLLLGAGANGLLSLGVVGAGHSTVQASALSEEDVSGILYVREEEKLARDVYQVLYERWGVAVFSQIARSEQQHMDAMLGLVERYGLDDPAAGHDVGVFVDPSLQELYDDLIARGEASLEGALLVGGYIEEFDIIDLDERIAATDQAAIQQVYGNLLRGSRNHLRAFVQDYERVIGEAYPVQVLEQDVFDAIIAGPMESGAPDGTGGGNAGNGRAHG
jgi:hypothetical protein